MTPAQRLAIALATVLDRLPSLPRRKPKPTPLITGSVFIYTGTETANALVAQQIAATLERHHGRRGRTVA